MSGLLQRAAEYRTNQRNLRLVKADSTDGLEELGGTPDERLEIADHIDGVINGSQIPIGPDTFVVSARKRGILLPFLVNIVAILLVAAGAFIILRTFADRETSVVNQSTALTSTEGRLLRQLREDSDAQLSEKDSEIAGIQNRLAQISAERAQLESSVNAQLSSQEEVLRSEFEAALAAEQDRLESGGLSEAEIATRLSEFEAQQQQDFSSQLNEIRAQAQQEIAEQEAALTALIDDAQQSLAAAESERSVLEAELRAQEVQLTAEFAAREAELTEERAAAVNLLADLQDQQQQEQFVLDQIVAFYSDVQSSLIAGNFDAALQSTESLRAYLSSGPTAELPTVQRRRRVELFLVESLEKRISGERALASPDTASLVESATLVSRVTELIATANSAYGAREFENARTIYLAALAEIPAVRVGYERLVELEAQAGQAESDRVASLVQRGNTLYRSGEFQEAAAVYGEVLATLPAADTDLLSRVLDAGYRLQSANDVSALRSVRSELEAAEAAAAERESRIAEQQVQLGEWQARLDEQATTLAALQAQLAEQEAELTALEVERSAERIQLARSESEATSLQDQVNALQAEIDSAATVAVADPAQAERIGQLESSIDLLNEEIAGKESEIVELKASLAERDDEITSQVAMIGELESIETESASVIAEQATTLAAVQAQLAEREAELTELEVELTEREVRLTELEVKLTELEVELARRESEATSLQRQVNALQTQIDSAATAATADSAQTERIAQLASRIELLNEEIAGKESEIADLRASLSERDDEIASQVAMIGELESSEIESTSVVAEQEEQISDLRLSAAELTALLTASQNDSAELRQQARSFAGLASFRDQQQDIADEIVRYHQRFVAPAVAASATTGPSSSLELLEAKLLILRIIGAESIQQQYPDLADQLNAYLDALVAEQRVEAAAATLAEVNEVLDFLLDDAESVRATRVGQFPPGLGDAGVASERFFSLLEELTRPPE